MNTPSVIIVSIHISAFKIITHSSQFIPLSISEFKFHTYPSPPSSTQKKMSGNKFQSQFPHNIDINYHTPPQEVNVEHQHHIKFNIHQLLVPGSFPRQSWRGTNIQLHPRIPFKTKNKFRVRSQWHRRNSKWHTWPIHASRPVPYYGWIGIQPPTTPRILSNDTRLSHRRNYKKTCPTAQGAWNSILHNQSLWWRP